MAILKVIFFILWLPSVMQESLFWISVWQKKDYKLDRLKAFIKMPSSRKILINKNNAIILILLALSVVLPLRFSTVASVLGIIYFGYASLRIAQKFQYKELSNPVFTIRSSAIIAAFLIIYASIAGALFMYLHSWFYTGLFAAALAVPLIIALIVGITHIFVAIIRKNQISRAKKKRDKMENLLVISLVGGYGKSVTADLLEKMLKNDFEVLKTPPHLTTSTSLAKFILKNLNKKHEILITELDSKRKGEVLRSVNIVSPQIGLLTGITSKNITFLGNMKSVQEAHYEIVKAMPKNGLMLFNGDDEYARALFRHCKTAKRLYTSDSLVETTPQKILFENTKIVSDGIEIHIREKGGSREILNTKLVGSHMITNIIGATTIARELGVSYENIKSALSDASPISRTLEIKQGIKETIAIDDTGSTNLNGIISALDILKRMKGKQKICIFQPIEELGSSAERVHKQIAAYMAEVCDQCIVTSTDYFSIMYDEAMENGMAKDSFVCAPDPLKALRKAQEICDKEDVILLENNIPEHVRKNLFLHVENNEV